jgi:hypothetical protein
VVGPDAKFESAREVVETVPPFVVGAETRFEAARTIIEPARARVVGSETSIEATPTFIERAPALVVGAEVKTESTHEIVEAVPTLVGSREENNEATPTFIEPAGMLEVGADAEIESAVAIVEAAPTLIVPAGPRVIVTCASMGATAAQAETPDAEVESPRVFFVGLDAGIGAAAATIESITSSAVGSLERVEPAHVHGGGDGPSSWGSDAGVVTASASTAADPARLAALSLLVEPDLADDGGVPASATITPRASRPVPSMLDNRGRPRVAAGRARSGT